MRRRVLSLAGLVLLAGCGGSPPAQDAGTLASSDTDLVVEVVAEPGGTPRRWTLSCDPPGGSHPDAAAACSALAGREAPLAPLAPDRVCAAVHSGPQTATVSGRYRGAPVDLALGRTDACRTAQWDALAPLLGG